MGTTARICRYHVATHLTQAGFAAAVLTLMLALPASGQPSEERSDGRIDSDGLSVGVFADVADAQTARLAQSTYTGPDGSTTEVYLPADPAPAGPTLGTTPGSLATGDIAFLHDPRVAPRPTLFEGALYASNNPNAHNTLLITVADADVTATEEGCAVAEVRSTISAITVQMAATPDGYYQAFVRILDPDPEKGHASSSGALCREYTAGVAQGDTAAILSHDGGRITVGVRGRGALHVSVDGEGPEFSDITPEGRREARERRITFEVHDHGSGLRHDGELVITPDGDYKQVNADGDNVTFEEPLSLRSEGTLERNGRAADIDLRVSTPGADLDPAQDLTDSGEWKMLGDRPGLGYFFSGDADYLDAGHYVLGLRAVDRVGNVTETGAVYDDRPPAVVQAWTGIGFDQQRKRETADRSWIMMDFGEPVSGAAAVFSRLNVYGNQVVEVVHLQMAQDSQETVMRLIAAAEGSSRDGEHPGSRLYIRLGRALRADETPPVLLEAGALRDVGGNTNSFQSVIPRDGIAPRFTVRVMAVEDDNPDFAMHATAETAPGRPLVGDEGAVAVDVTADEALTSRPAVYFTGIRVSDNSAGKTPEEKFEYSMGEGLRMATAPAREDQGEHWRGTYRAAALSGFHGLFGLVVVGEDAAGNTGATSGWKPSRHQGAGPPALGDPLDLESMDMAGLLLEADRQFNGTLPPAQQVTFRGRDDDEMKSDLFVQLDFFREGKEYERGTYVDSHGVVTITEITLDGEDAAPLLTRLGNGMFELVARNPGESHHDIEYRVRDEAGNELSLEVHVRPLDAPEPPYEVALHPGWNLVSLPGTPVRPALRDVVPGTGLVTPVLSYQEGDWVSAVLDENGTWRGRLQEITGGYGYWMFSVAPQTIAALIPAQDRRETLPTVPVTHGWNLLGVVDLFRNAEGEPPGPEDGNGGEADHYFATIPWRLAYTFDTPRNRWVRLIPRDDEAGTPHHAEPPDIVNGRGYWVWSEEPSTLVP